MKNSSPKENFASYVNMFPTSDELKKLQEQNGIKSYDDYQKFKKEQNAPFDVNFLIRTPIKMSQKMDKVVIKRMVK